MVGEYLLFPLCVPLEPMGSYPGWLLPLLPAAGDVPFVAAAVMLVYKVYVQVLLRIYWDMNLKRHIYNYRDSYLPVAATNHACKSGTCK